jgi:hypothetical protein
MGGGEGGRGRGGGEAAGLQAPSPCGERDSVAEKAARLLLAFGSD